MEGWTELATSFDQNGKPIGGYIVPSGVAEIFLEAEADAKILNEVNAALAAHWRAIVANTLEVIRSE